MGDIPSQRPDFASCYGLMSKQLTPIGIDLLLSLPREGLTWILCTWFCCSLKNPTSHPWLRKQNDRSTEPYISATFRLDYSQWRHVSSTNCGFGEIHWQFMHHLYLNIQNEGKAFACSMHSRCLSEGAVKPRRTWGYLSCNPCSLRIWMRRLTMRNALCKGPRWTKE